MRTFFGFVQKEGGEQPSSSRWSVEVSGGRVYFGRLMAGTEICHPGHVRINHPSFQGAPRFSSLPVTGRRGLGGLASAGAWAQCTARDICGRVNHVLLRTGPALSQARGKRKKGWKCLLCGGMAPAAFSNLEKDLMPRAGPFQLLPPAAPVTSGPFVGVSNAVLKKTRSCSLHLLLQGPVSLNASQVLWKRLGSPPRPWPSPGKEPRCCL